MQKGVLLLPFPEHAVNLLSEFRTFREDGKFIDLSLVCCDGIRVPCHSLVLGTSNPFWRGVLKSLHGLGFHGVDGSSVVDILMPELKGAEVEEFVRHVYDPHRYENCRTDRDKVFLLTSWEPGAHRPEDDYRDLNILEPDTVVREEDESMMEDLDPDHQKIEPSDADDDEDEGYNPPHYEEYEEEEEEEEHEDSELEITTMTMPENCCQPGIYSGSVDAIVCFGGEDQQRLTMHVILQKGEKDREVIHQAVHCLCHLVGFEFRRFYRKVMDDAHGFHRPSQQITSNSVLCSEERKLIKTAYLRKMRSLRKEGGEISAPPSLDKSGFAAECFSAKSCVRRLAWFRSYERQEDGGGEGIDVSFKAGQVKRFHVATMNLKNVDRVGKLEVVDGQTRYKNAFDVSWTKPTDQSACGITLARTGKPFNDVKDGLFKLVADAVSSLDALQTALKICPTVAKTLAVEKHKIESTVASECLFKYTCNVCCAVFSRLDKSKFQLHKKDHDPTCNVCGLKFPTGVVLEQHKNANHRPQRKFKCEEGNCNYKASSQKALDNHTTKNHKDFVACSKCGDIQRSGVIKYHEKHCGMKKACPACGKMYSSQHLKAHVQTAHNAEGSSCYPCDTCGKTFNNRANLGRHVDRIHRQDAEKNYVCKTCGRGFMTLDAMESHETVHTGEKPKACRYCDKKYKSSSTTRHHERTKHPELYQHRMRKKKVGMEKYQSPPLKLKFYGENSSHHSNQSEDHQQQQPCLQNQLLLQATTIPSSSTPTPIPPAHLQLPHHAQQQQQMQHHHHQQLQQLQHQHQHQAFPHPLALHLPFSTPHQTHHPGHPGLHLPPHHMQH